MRVQLWDNWGSLDASAALCLCDGVGLHRLLRDLAMCLLAHVHVHGDKSFLGRGQRAVKPCTSQGLCVSQAYAACDVTCFLGNVPFERLLARLGLLPESRPPFHTCAQCMQKMLCPSDGVLRLACPDARLPVHERGHMRLHACVCVCICVYC